MLKSSVLTIYFTKNNTSHRASAIAQMCLRNLFIASPIYYKIEPYFYFFIARRFSNVCFVTGTT